MEVPEQNDITTGRVLEGVETSMNVVLCFGMEVLRRRELPSGRG